MISGLGWARYQSNLEHLFMPDSKKVLANIMEAGHRGIEARIKSLHWTDVDHLNTIVIKAVKNYKPLERKKFLT